MKIKLLDAQTSVSDQLTIDDVAVLAEQGIECIVCNRPDNEAAGQQSFKTIAKEAESLAIKAINIPFSGQMTEKQTAEFAELLSQFGRLHAYCRTGNRSTTIWAEAQTELGRPTNNILAIANAAGFDVSKSLHTSKLVESNHSVLAKPAYDVVIVGAGSGGIATAASLLKRQHSLRIALVDPSDEHYYQPGWSLVGAGVMDVQATRRNTRELVPANATWIKAAVTDFNPTENCVNLNNGKTLYYKHLVIAPGLILNWQAVDGLIETLGRNGVTSNYRHDLAPYSWQLVSQLKQGKAIFTQPAVPIKCAGAPQTALYLAADHWLKSGLIKQQEIEFYSASDGLFNVDTYVPVLQSYMDKYQANIHYSHKLVKIDGESKLAWFTSSDVAGKDTTVCTHFDMIHVCPPQIPPTFISNSMLSDESGWLDVHTDTLQHISYENIWGLGDVINTPNAKTMAAVGKQAPVVAQNIVDCMQRRAASAAYDGYGACPLIVERGKVVLAEYGYDQKNPANFPSWLFDGTKASCRSWLLVSKIWPELYWQGMLKGREWLAKPNKLSK